MEIKTPQATGPSSLALSHADTPPVVDVAPPYIADAHTGQPQLVGAHSTQPFERVNFQLHARLLANGIARP